MTRIGVWRIERENPPVGAFATVNDTLIHYLDLPAGPDADLPTLVFIHGASGNLKDPMIPFRTSLEGRARLLFFDRPGHGWSGRGPAENIDPDGQAKTLAALLDRLAIRKAVIVAHSFGGSVAASFALAYPEKTGGLLFLSAATHPWPGGKTNWYYDLAKTPLLGRLFVETLALPAGLARLEEGSRGVFAPDPMPAGYVRDASIALVLRPNTFMANAINVARLHDYVSRVAPRYPEIASPAIIISGDADAVVLEEVHSKGLARDIRGSELVWVTGLGHKPDYAANGLAVAAIEKLAGRSRDLQAMAKDLGAQLLAAAPRSNR